MRTFFLLVLLAGLGLGVGLPFYENNFAGRELATQRIYERGGAFRPVEVNLSAADAPLNIIVDLTTMGTPTFVQDRTVLTLTVAHNGRTDLTDTMNFVNIRPREYSPQQPDRIYRSFAGPLRQVENGHYVLTFGFGDAERINARHIDVTLRAGAQSFDPRLQPIGYALIAVGVIGLILALRRKSGGGRNDGAAPPVDPPAPRWGRDAGGSRP